jgi:SAM-dependent methyltransferase
VKYWIKKVIRLAYLPWALLVQNRLNMHRNRLKEHRRLEIGPGHDPVPGFETLNIVPGRNTDYALDCSRRLPFPDDVFEVLYASHILEHIPWYHLEPTLSEWIRILQPGGQLEIWVPDGVKICAAFLDAELRNDNYIDLDGWYRFNETRDPCVWASGRVFSYGDGTGSAASENWHRALFSRRYLATLLQQAGLVDIREMSRTEVRGYDHGWINMGFAGTKS